MHERTFQVEYRESKEEDFAIITLYIPDDVDDEEYIDVWVSEHLKGSYDWEFDD